MLASKAFFGFCTASTMASSCNHPSSQLAASYRAMLQPINNLLHQLRARKCRRCMHSSLLPRMWRGRGGLIHSPWRLFRIARIHESLRFICQEALADCRNGSKRLGLHIVAERIWHACHQQWRRRLRPPWAAKLCREFHVYEGMSYKL